MPSIARLGDGSSHGGSVISANQNVKTADGILVAVQGALHSCPIPGHGVTAFGSGSPVTSAEGKGVVRVGVDACGCGAVVVGGSPTTSTG